MYGREDEAGLIFLFLFFPAPPGWNRRLVCLLVFPPPSPPPPRSVEKKERASDVTDVLPFLFCGEKIYNSTNAFFLFLE